MKLEKLEKRVELPEGVTASLNGKVLTVKGPGAELIEEFPSKRVQMKAEGNMIFVAAEQVTKREKKIIGTYVAHIKNMAKGAVEPFVYKLKICSSHFPMSVAVDNGTFIVKNFIGEVVPRKLKLKEGVEVAVEGQDITVKANDKKIAGQVAADIEQLTRRTAYDRRIFQDGIYIVEKPGKPITW